MTSNDKENVIQLIKAITKEKSSQLFVTTRSRMLDDLQFQLCQLAFSLENLSKNDQINHLTSYYMKELKVISYLTWPVQSTCTIEETKRAV